MKRILLFLLILAATSSLVHATMTPTTDSFDWTLYDDFSDQSSYYNWIKDGGTYNLSTFFGLDGKLVFRSYARQWDAIGNYYASLPDENVRGIKADISLKSNETFADYGNGRNVVGVKLAPNFEIYMGFFSHGYQHNLQIGYCLDGQEIIPEDWNSQQMTFEQDYEVAIALSDNGQDIMFFLDNQLFEMIGIYPGSQGVEKFFVETNISSLESDFAVDNFCVLIPEPATLLLFGFGGLILKKRKFNGGKR